MAGVTGFGDASVTITAAALLFLCFLASSRPVAWQWLKAVVACGVLTACLKTALYLHGAPRGPLSLFSPSGHVAGSVLIYGVLPLGLLAGAADGAAPPPLPGLAARLAAPAVGAGLLLIAVSRVYLHAHTPLDVVAGACIGGGSLAWFGLRPWRGALQASVRPAIPLIAAVCVGADMMGWHLHLDRLLHLVAGALRAFGGGA